MRTLLILMLLCLFMYVSSSAITDKDGYIIDTLKDLRSKLQEKLGDLKTLAEAAKAGGAMAKEEAKKAIDALKLEIGALRNEIRNKLKEIFGGGSSANRFIVPYVA